jgi:hypothetical protein
MALVHGTLRNDRERGIPLTPDVIAGLQFVKNHRFWNATSDPWRFLPLSARHGAGSVGLLIGNGSAREGITVAGDASSQKGTLWLVEGAASVSRASIYFDHTLVTATDSRFFMKLHLLFDPRPRASSVPTTRNSSRSRAGPIKGGRALRGHPSRSCCRP